ncbi:MAG: L-fucose/L-arabinose isomerase family protein [Bacteroidota bacterium]
MINEGNLEAKVSEQITVDRIKPLTAKIGIYGVGHYNYWPQFPGLLEEMHKKMDILADKVRGNGVEVVDFGIGDDAESAYRIVNDIKASGIDMLFIDMVTYATSSTIAIIFRELNIPMVTIALQPLKALDYENATTFIQLVNDDICSIPEFNSVAQRLGKPIPDVVIGTLEGDDEADAEIAEFCQIAKVLHDLKKARIGYFGHPLESMYDMHVDHTAMTAAFGCHVVQTEPDDIMAHYLKVTEDEVDAYKNRILEFFDTPEPKVDPVTRKLTDVDLYEAAKSAVALEKFIEEKKLDGLAYYYEGREGTDMRKLVTNLIVGNSLLTAGGFPMCGEADLKTNIAMMIMDRLEIGGSFAEFHPIDFKEGFVLVGHDGPHHVNIADGKPVIRSLIKYHGKPGSGASVEFKIKEGPITMLGITSKADGTFKFVITEGESVVGPVPATGNTNTRGFFKPDIKTFLKDWFAEGPTHHYALGVGKKAHTIKKIADFLGIEAVIVSEKYL